jgi:hypothetical protein
MKAGEVVFQGLLDGKIQYRVPLFQRTYSWNERNWEQLWDDLIEVYDADPRRAHFLGAVVTLPIPDSPENAAKFMLIDGQQRLTTLLILVATIRDLARASGLDDHLADEIEANCLRNVFARRAEEAFKFQPTDADAVAFAAVVEGKDPGKTRIGDARRYFERAIAAGNEGGRPIELPILKSVITDYVNLVSIRLDQDDSPHRIFESLNHTGTPLSDADLVRNHVFMRLKSEDAQRQVYRDHWFPMQSRLEFENGRSELTDFFWRFLMMQGELPRYDEVYEGMRAWIDGRVDRDKVPLPAVLDELDRFSTLYLRIAHPEAVPQSTALAQQLGRLNAWEVSVAYPFILFALDLATRMPAPVISEDDLVAVVRMIESYVVRRLICGIPTNRLRRIFGRMARQVSTEHFVASAEQYLLANDWPSDDLFRERFQTNPLYQNARLDRTRQILVTLERRLAGKEQVEITPTITVEHVMPQTLSEWWTTALAPDAAAVHETWLHTAGNLTLTGYNSELGNLPFPTKQTMLAESKFALSKEIVAASGWTARDITNRARHLADLAVELWSRPVAPAPPQVASPVATAAGPLGEVLGIASALGVGEELGAIATRATDLGLALRPDRYSLMVSPPRDKRVMLFTVWPQSLEGGSFRIWRSAKAFADYIPGVTQNAAIAALGEDGEGTLPRLGVADFLDHLSQLLANRGLAAAPTEWGWGRYTSELRVPPERLAIAQALVEALEAAAAARNLPWRLVYRRGYVALQRPGGYNVAAVDFHYFATTRLAVKLPADPATLHLENPYPGRNATWHPAYRDWAWFVPSLADLPDVERALDIALPFHPAGGAMRVPPATPVSPGTPADPGQG